MPVLFLKALQVLNFVVFLQVTMIYKSNEMIYFHSNLMIFFFQEGKYPTLSRRLFSLQLKRSTAYSGRNLNYDYISR